MFQEQLSNLVPLATRLITIHQTLSRKHEEEMTPRLASLTGLIAETLMSSKLQENIWLSAQAVVAKEIRSLLTEDARCLLPTVSFKRFVSDTLENVMLTTVSEIGISSNTTNWSLLSLPSSLKLLSFRDCDREQGDHYSVETQVGDWRQALQVPLSAQQTEDALDENWDCLFQWHYITNHLDIEGISFSGAEQLQKESLKREISCVICYVAQLLHSYSLVNAFTYP